MSNNIVWEVSLVGGRDAPIWAILFRSFESAKRFAIEVESSDYKLVKLERHVKENCPDEMSIWRKQCEYDCVFLEPREIRD